MGWAYRRDADGLVVAYGRVPTADGLGPCPAGCTAVPWDGEPLEMAPEPVRYQVSEEALRALQTASLKADLEAAKASILAETGPMPAAAKEVP